MGTRVWLLGTKSVTGASASLLEPLQGTASTHSAMLLLVLVPPLLLLLLLLLSRIVSGGRAGRGNQVACPDVHAGDAATP